MKPSLSIRSYTRTMCMHAHDYYQLVLPLNGHIDISLNTFSGCVGVGEGICIAPGAIHGFTADEQAKFIVADLPSVPGNIAGGTLFADGSLPADGSDPAKGAPIFQISTPMQAFLAYVEVQLTHHITDDENDAMLSLFSALLAQQQRGVATDKRIIPVLSCIHQDVAYPHTITSLAKIACVGATQFKKRFIAATGMGLREYLINVRMEKARALLSNTDMPIIAVAVNVGYDDVSAFTRRFKHHVGMPPTHFKRR
ncbi:AraC family transcriptional regulator [Alteromonas sp. 76-1]|uniref:AraC family transcriptional regulator n=1 Tax=Alteromonas sp. 76-1 TaxID=2358187 RepID=UPI000FD17498|nr:AraC family transcriptional regulator [Alteromonas sp. 76-1]VEL95441.1 AraC family transcriptional regulator [Alteromonas sp. 76-1]